MTEPIESLLTGIDRRLATIEGQLTGVDRRLATVEGKLAGIEHRLAAIEGRLTHLQTIGTWLFAGLLGSYAAILAVALRVH
jgi:hypothetical protein